MSIWASLIIYQKTYMYLIILSTGQLEDTFVKPQVQDTVLYLY